MTLGRYKWKETGNGYFTEGNKRTGHAPGGNERTPRCRHSASPAPEQGQAQHAQAEEIQEGEGPGNGSKTAQTCPRRSRRGNSNTGGQGKKPSVRRPYWDRHYTDSKRNRQDPGKEGTRVWRSQAEEIRDGTRRDGTGNGSTVWQGHDTHGHYTYQIYWERNRQDFGMKGIRIRQQK